MAEEILESARRRVEKDPKLADFKVRAEGHELHLSKGAESFARLIPAEKAGYWRMEYFHNLERWEAIDFMGTLDECLDFLAHNIHYLFWNRG